MNQEMKTGVRTSKEMEIARAGNNMSIKPKALATPESDKETKEHDQFAGTPVTSPSRHKVNAAFEAYGLTQEGE